MLVKRVKYRQNDPSQIQIFHDIINKVKLPSKTMTRNMKVLATNIILWKYSTLLFGKRFHYHGSIRHQICLENITHLGISYPTYQYACFSEYPALPHGDEVKIFFYAYRKPKTTEYFHITIKIIALKFL